MVLILVALLVFLLVYKKTLVSRSEESVQNKPPATVKEDNVG